ncbi:metalloendoproteinase 4-MMP-like [Papaver somniferum]|uniref:metalloendoproteinase 4-MMP-like n=1 Tax=Papaver somniferum TaxID=3469 RepID=UPI000E705C8E|nr:metalloendoproteinase 4-MMP-like [Papaver somniferum]
MEQHQQNNDCVHFWPTLLPLETQDYEHANITTGFYYGDHGDGAPFVNKTVLAHATGPGSGAQIHFNAAFTWSVDFNSEKSEDAFDLESVAIHEIGHVLGLDHSSVQESVMSIKWPSIQPRAKKLDLSLDDVNGAQI